jgi:hypothetical protein
MAVNGDLTLPVEVPVHCPGRLANAYFARLLEAADHDPILAETVLTSQLGARGPIGADYPGRRAPGAVRQSRASTPTAGLGPSRPHRARPVLLRRLIRHLFSERDER